LGIGSGPDQYPDAVAARLGISNSDLWERGIGRDPATLDRETVSMPAYSYTDPDGVVLSSEADLDAAAEPILRLEHDVRTCSPALWNATTTPIAAEMLSRYLGGQRSVEALYLGFTGQLGPASILFRYHHDVGTGPERAWIESYVGSWIAAGMPSIPPRAS
jgi:hypothetical protein